MSWENFAKAPIAEAVLDIRCDAGNGQVADWSNQLKSWQSSHPTREQIHEAQLSFRVVSGEVLGSTSHPRGFRFLNESKTRILQARHDGFTVNHLAPYDSWHTLRDEARERWPEYVGVASPTTCTRLALRYVNRIVLPGEGPYDLAHYFNVEPKLEGEMPRRLLDFSLRCMFQLSEARAILNQSRSVDGEQVAVVLDLDVFREGRFAPTDTEIWTVFETLRDVKNQIFFAATTDACKELFR